MALTRAQEAAAVILLATGAGEISLAGGAGLIAHGITDRDTKDLDAFTRDAKASTHELAARVRAAFERANYRVVDDSAYPEASLRRLLVTPAGHHRGGPGRKPETVKVEIGQDFQALPAIPTSIGPVLDPHELGANKILTVYVDTRARDGDDLARLITRYRFDDMLAVADQKEVEPLDRHVLADQMRLFGRLADSEFRGLDPTQAQAVKQFMVDAADRVAAGRPVDSALSPYSEHEADPSRGADINSLLDATQPPDVRRRGPNAPSRLSEVYRAHGTTPDRDARDRGPER